MGNVRRCGFEPVGIMFAHRTQSANYTHRLKATPPDIVYGTIGRPRLWSQSGPFSSVNKSLSQWGKLCAQPFNVHTPESY